MYHSRKWLNGINKPSTGSVISYEGQSDWSSRIVQFFEVSDCHGKVRLHRADNDTIDDFIKKLRIVSKEADTFANHLEKANRHDELVESQTTRNGAER